MSQLIDICCNNPQELTMSIPIVCVLARSLFIEEIKLLLKNKCNINKLNTYKHNALINGCGNNYLNKHLSYDCMKLLIKSGININ